MVRSSKAIFFLLFLAVCAVQITGAACSDDCLRQSSSTPHPAQDSQTEPDGAEGESALELALAQGDGLPVIHLISRCVLDTSLCPRSAFLSDWFRPPTGI
ncbi:MAG TPA: hypothetical protein VFR82_08055 [Nitrospira sp.]|nr:hypothetical protein [Nitrospira sp.]